MRGSEYAELTAFVAVAEQQSFSRAAARLGVSPSALSQTIRQLEERLGARLLNRTTRSVALSKAGERLMARLVPSMSELDAAVAEVRASRDAPSGTLRINAPPVNDMALLLRAALDGVGIVYTLEDEMRPWLEAGRLVRVLKDWSPRFPGFHLYYPSRRQVPAPLRALLDFLKRRRAGAPLGPAPPAA